MRFVAISGMVPRALMSDQPYLHTPEQSAAEMVDELVRAFNTAMIASQSTTGRDISAEIYLLMESPAFRAILNAVRQHARLQGITERQASEQVIATFRKMDDLWSAYVHQEGVNQLKSLE